MNIRDAERKDLEAIVDIYNPTIPSWVATADTEPVSVESKIKWFDEHQPGFRPLWVVEQNEIVVGWLSYSSFYGRPAYHRTAEISIYVRSEHRGKGIASSLLQEAIHHAPKLGLKNLLGFVFGHNTPSIRLFEKFGFRTWGRLPCIAVLDGIERDLVILGLRLNEKK